MTLKLFQKHIGLSQNVSLIKSKYLPIPPLLVNGTFETDFGKKAGILNIFFADQCSIINNGSVLPEISYKTDKRLINIIISS